MTAKKAVKKKASKKVAKKLKYPDGKKIKAFREKFSPTLTQTQLASYLGTCRQQITAWEAGHERPTEYADALFELTGI